MQFTGERYVPSERGQIRYEHLHCYALAMSLAAGKRVLDIASGEGYGAALLGQTARFVVGADIDAASVAHAQRTYGHLRHVHFTPGKVDAIPLRSACVDLVASFETLEHVAAQDTMLSEIKRVLVPGGLLILSSPNRAAYAEQRDEENPFHVKELDQAELLLLLRHYFQHVQLYGQRLATGSFLYRLDSQSRDSRTQTYTANANNQVEMKSIQYDDPVYFVAICSDDVAALPAPSDSIFADNVDDLFAERFAAIRWLQSEVRNAKQRTAEYEHQVSELNARWLRQTAQLAEQDRYVHTLEAQFIAQTAQIHQLQGQLRQWSLEYERLNAEAGNLRAELQKLQSTATVRLSRRFRMAAAQPFARAAKQVVFRTGNL